MVVSGEKKKKVSWQTQVSGKRPEAGVSGPLALSAADGSHRPSSHLCSEYSLCEVMGVYEVYDAV